ncbi:MAG: hypothetical protein ACSLE0_04420 [Chitinophagaceae bacterium]
MLIEVSKNKTIAELQSDFRRFYPFLRLDFYNNTNGKLGTFLNQKLNGTMFLDRAGNKREGGIQLMDSMTIEALEKTFQNRFGMLVQVSRKSGTVWLQTTMTDSWTLKQQNEHGRELSLPDKNTSPNIEID